MSKRLLGATVFASVLLALLLVGTVLGIRLERWHRAEKRIGEYRETAAQLAPSAVKKQEKLAKWYNFCLTGNHAGQDFREAYGGIWNFSRDMMGYLSIPALDVEVPIYHGCTARPGEMGAGHVPGSALPIGGLGNHTVLMIPEEASGLTVGEVFCIYAPGRELYYRVAEVMTLAQGQVSRLKPTPGEDRCTLTAVVKQGVKTEKRVIYGLRTQTLPEVKCAGVDAGVLHAAARAMLGTLLLPLVTGTAGFLFRQIKKRMQKTGTRRALRPTKL